MRIYLCILYMFVFNIRATYGVLRAVMVACRFAAAAVFALVAGWCRRRWCPPFYQCFVTCTTLHFIHSHELFFFSLALERESSFLCFTHDGPAFVSMFVRPHGNFLFFFSTLFSLVEVPPMALGIDSLGILDGCCGRVKSKIVTDMCMANMYDARV